MIQSEPLSCREIVELVTEYLERSMPAERRLGFEEHIAICPPCRNFLLQFRKTIELGKTIEENDLPPEVRASLVDVFRDWRDESARNSKSGE